MNFYLFKHTLDKSIVGVTGEPTGAKLPVLPGNGQWEPFTKFEESGRPRVGFSEEQARADIEKRGYHLARTEIRVSRVSTQPQQ